MLNTIEESKAIVRPLRTLIPLIKTNIERGDREGERAARPHYENAGAELIEAAMSDERGYSAFWDWAEESFGRNRKFLRSCMEFAFENNGKFQNATTTFETLDELLRSAGKKRHFVNRTRDSVNEEVRDTMRNVKGNEYARPAAVTPKASERTLRNKLALQLIDVGYKALAVKLHPDKSKEGSNEAMARLNAVRTMLKNAVR